MRFMVYQRRMLVEAMKTKALILAAINPDKAVQAAQEYMEMCIPIDEGSQDELMRRRERELDELTNMKPITVGQIKAGSALSGTQQWGTSMHRKPPSIAGDKT
jgi:hypothetical protein